MYSGFYDKVVNVLMKLPGRLEPDSHGEVKNRKEAPYICHSGPTVYDEARVTFIFRLIHSIYLCAPADSEPNS